MSAQARSEVRDLLARHSIRPTKARGQHFLVDPNITRKIVATAELAAGESVVEVGAGTGTLTSTLAEAGHRVVAYEIDRGLEPLLTEVLAGLDVDLRFADAARVDWGSDLDQGTWVMVANLPYNVGTSIVLDALRGAPDIVRFVVMVQLEVAQRFVAAPGTDAYGLPSVVVGLHGSARLEFTVPPQVFLPPPNVGSAVVRIDRHDAPDGSERAIALAAAGFGQRRKMLRRSLAALLDDPGSVIESAGLDPTARAEDLDPGSWLALAAVSP